MNGVPQFYDKLLEGYYFKEIVRMILDFSDYMVFPYGFESTFSYIKIRLHKHKIKDTATVRRIRSSPDLLVYDANKGKVWLVEVKSRNYDQEDSVRIDKVSWYRRYWRDSLLVVIIPHGHWFYAQYAWKLEEKNEYDLREEFEKLENFFPNVNTDTLYHFKSAIAEKMKRQIDAYYFPEKDDRFFVPKLLEVVEKNQGKTEDQLFGLYNRDELVSKELFSTKLEEQVQARKLRRRRNRFYC